MKKLLSILLLLCLLTPVALAESSDLYVQESHIHAYAEGENTLLHVVFLLENRGSTAFLPAVASVVLLNKQGEIFQESRSSMYPMVLSAGGSGYVFGTFELDAAQQQQYDHPELRLALSSYSDEEQKLVDQLLAALLYPKVESEIRGNQALLTVTNDTALDIPMGGILLLYKDEAGEIVGVQETYITHLPQGESTQITQEFTLAPFASVEIICYSMPM